MALLDSRIAPPIGLVCWLLLAALGCDSSADDGDSASDEGSGTPAADGGDGDGDGDGTVPGDGDGDGTDPGDGDGDGTDPGDGDGDTAPSEIELEALCALLREKAQPIVCDGEQGADECDGLLDSARGAVHCDAVIGAVEAGRFEYDGAAAQTCVDQRDDDALGRAYTDLSFYCDDAFTGTVADQESCYWDYGFATDECGADLYCAFGGSCPGTCRTFQQRGDACPTDGRCAPDLACIRDCTPPCDGVCGDRPGEGGDCQLSQGVCAEGLICDVSQDPFTCVTPAALGEACESDYVCESFVCDDGECVEERAPGCGGRDECEADEGCYPGDSGKTECQPALADGAACIDGFESCAGRLRCLWNIDDSQSYCRERAGIDGEPCLPWACEEDHYCANEEGVLTCRPDRAMGGNCIDVSQGVLPSYNTPCQAGLHCMLSGGGTCLPPGAMDEPCYYNNVESCQAGLVCAGFALSTCQPPSALGDNCSPAFDNACSEGYCKCDMVGQSCTWSCTALLDNGEECEDPRECNSGYCDFDESVAVCADEPDPASMLCLP